MKPRKGISAILSIILIILLVSCAKEQDSEKQGSGQEIKNLTGIVLAENSTTEYKIVMPNGATEAVGYAASELQKYFEEATGAEIEVVTDKEKTYNTKDKVLSVGETVYYKGSKISVTQKELTSDGYKVQRKENSVIICGASDTATCYGVYEFLARQFGFEVYAVDEIALEKSEKTYLIDFNLTDIPSFEGRDLDGLTDYNFELGNKLRLRKYNCIDACYGYGASQDWVGGHCHSFLTIVSPTVYNDEVNNPENYHPEWFSSRQLCLTNEGLKSEFVKNVIELLEANPNGKYVNMAEEDFGGLCTCAECKNEMSLYKSSGYIVRFCNYVIENVEAWLAKNQAGRELKYLTFAYSSGSVHPPVVSNNDGSYSAIDASVVPHEKLYIRFAPISYCYSHALTDTTCKINVNCAADINGWRAITDRFMIWDYDVNYNNYFMFFNIYDSLQTNLLNYKEMGVINIIRESCTGSRVASMIDLKNYITAKLMWNVNLSQEELTDDFMEQFYKGGARYMKEYLNMVRSHLKLLDANDADGLHFQLYNSYQPTLPTPQVWTKRILEQSMELFEKAYAEFEKLDDKLLAEKLRLRVLKESLCVRYLIIQNYGSYYNINDTKYKEMVEEFEKDVETLSAFTYAEVKNTSSWIDAIKKNF